MTRNLVKFVALLAGFLLGFILFSPIARADVPPAHWQVTQTVPGTFVIQNIGGIQDHPVVFSVSSYTVPSTWDGNGFDASASPQVEYAYVQVVYPSGQHDPLPVPVLLPKCGAVQDDVYFGPEQKTVTYPQGTTNLVKGKIWRESASCPTPTPTPTGTPTPSPRPTIHHNPPPFHTPTPSPSHPSSSQPTTPGVRTPTLPKTGADTVVIPLGAAAILLLVGTGLLISTRNGRH